MLHAPEAFSFDEPLSCRAKLHMTQALLSYPISDALLDAGKSTHRAAAYKEIHLVGLDDMEPKQPNHQRSAPSPCAPEKLRNAAKI